MTFSKRDFLKLGGAALVGSAVASNVKASSDKTVLSDITGDMKPISRDERLARVAKAQELMAQKGIDAILLEPGSAMLYFTGIRWWRSERMTAVVIPAKGDIAIVTPFFEEPSVRESMTFGDDVRPWHEHESPFAHVNAILNDRGIAGGKIGLENTVRYFIVDGLKRDAHTHEIVSAEPITRGCRMYKSAHEIELMRKANEVTLTAYRHVWDTLEVGMTPDDVNAKMSAAQKALGGSGIWNMALLNEASAFPHGSEQPQEVRNGSVVLMDCGCSVHGYQSDISRTFVYGEATTRQREVWNLVRAGQQIAMETATIGTAAGKVDDAVRKLYEAKGFGPGYATPGLPHRTGHGIGMDGHESVNFVHGETEKLASGMCFSNEPGIYIMGEFGVRLEDCIYMTDSGPKWFTEPPSSIDAPIGKMGGL